MASIPTQRTIAELKKQGYTCHIVERFNTFIKRRQDFGGWADILAYRAGEVGVLGIQTTSDSNVSSRVKKLTVLDPADKLSAGRLSNIRAWLGSKNRVEIWGWGLRGARGARKVWTLSITQVTRFAEYANDLPGKSVVVAAMEIASDLAQV